MAWGDNWNPLPKFHKHVSSRPSSPRLIRNLGNLIISLANCIEKKHNKPPFFFLFIWPLNYSAVFRIHFHAPV